MNLELFLESNNPNVRNLWVTCQQFTMYLRRSNRIIGNKLVRVIDLANIEAPEKTRGKGRFKKFLPILFDGVKVHGYDGMFVENVLTPEFAEFWRKQGYEEIPLNGEGNPPCFYKAAK